MKKFVLTVLPAALCAALAGCATHAPQTISRASATLPATAESAPKEMACPAKAELPAGTRCLTGQDSAGAFYLIITIPLSLLARKFESRSARTKR